MANSDILVFEQAVVWLNGVSQVGHVKEIELPELTWKTMDHEAIGLRGVSQYATTMEALELTLEFMDYAKDLSTAAGDPFSAVDLQIRQAYGAYRSGSRVRTAEVVVFARGRFISNSLGSISQGELEKEAMMTCDYIKVVAEGVVSSEFSINPPILRTGGVDRLEAVRAILGI